MLLKLPWAALSRRLYEARSTRRAKASSTKGFGDALVLTGGVRVRRVVQSSS
ncbi:hypothetical protein [Janthinobacterium lividum]|uniref:hypothetical protein n=1 Tax=Janthinobacterium sp. LB2P10 TaxID=3424194 RepID=UPI001ABFDEA9|nr:hypothetical protein [Janthinobacterium lividum]